MASGDSQVKKSLPAIPIGKAIEILKLCLNAGEVSNVQDFDSALQAGIDALEQTVPVTFTSGRISRRRAGEVILQYLKLHHADSQLEFENTLRLAWHALLGTERAGSPSSSHESTQENNKAGITSDSAS